MTPKTKKFFCKAFKALTNSTFLRKKKIFYVKTKKLKNLKLKLQLITYNSFSQSLKYMGIYQTYKSNINFNSIFF